MIEGEPAEVHVELDEMPLPKRRGRPKGKAKPKEPKDPKEPKKPEQVRKGKPEVQVPQPQLDMNTLTRMLAEHLAGEKQTARAKRHETWDSFF